MLGWSGARTSGNRTAGRMGPDRSIRNSCMAEVREFEFKEPAARTADAPGMLAHAPEEPAAQSAADMPGEKMVLNMGPSHPATHGVLRIGLELDGESITRG